MKTFIVKALKDFKNLFKIILVSNLYYKSLHEFALVPTNITIQFVNDVNMN